MAGGGTSSTTALARVPSKPVTPLASCSEPSRHSSLGPLPLGLGTLNHTWGHISTSIFLVVGAMPPVQLGTQGYSHAKGTKALEVCGKYTGVGWGGRAWL